MDILYGLTLPRNYKCALGRLVFGGVVGRVGARAARAAESSPAAIRHNWPVRIINNSSMPDGGVAKAF